MWCSHLSCTSPTCQSWNSQRSGHLSSVVVWCQWNSQHALWRCGWCHPDALRQTNAERRRRWENGGKWNLNFITTMHDSTRTDINTHKLYECIPVCWSPRKGCRIPPGNQRPRRSPLRYDSRRNTPPGWCAGRSGRCRLASPLNTQASLCRSSGACSSCNAVQHTCCKTFWCHHSGKRTQIDHFSW